MSRARHHEGKPHHEKKHHRAHGGDIAEASAGGGSDIREDILKEAKSKKDVGKVEGERAKKRGDRLAVKHGGKVHHRAHGGRVGSGSDKSPFSSAHGSGPKVEAGGQDLQYENAHKHGGKVEKHGEHPVHHEHHGHAVKHAAKHGEHKRGGRC